jgi:hypothetical protein
MLRNQYFIKLNTFFIIIYENIFIYLINKIIRFFINL